MTSILCKPSHFIRKDSSLRGPKVQKSTWYRYFLLTLQAYHTSSVSRAPYISMSQRVVGFFPSLHICDSDEILSIGALHQITTVGSATIMPTKVCSSYYNIDHTKLAYMKYAIPVILSQNGLNDTIRVSYRILFWFDTVYRRFPSTYRFSIRPISCRANAVSFRTRDAQTIQSWSSSLTKYYR